MKSALAFLWMFALGCASSAPPTSAPRKPAETAFAAGYLDRPTAAPTPRPDTSKGPGKTPARAPMKQTAKQTPKETAETRGLLRVAPTRLVELRRIAGDDALVTAALNKPFSVEDLEALAWLRSPDVAAARARVEAARTGLAQAADLRDLVGVYRAFLRNTNTRVGPERSRRAAARIAPSPNVDALSGEIVNDSIGIAFEALRKTVRGTVAAAERAHADAARLAAARRILDDDVELHEALVEVVRARFEAGRASQAALLTFRARLDALRTERAVLDDEATLIRARWNRLLRRPEAAPVGFDMVAPVPLPGTPSHAETIKRAAGERQEQRAAALRLSRARSAVRLAETMTLPRFDLGSSRFERERAGEASVQRGAIFPEPGRMIMPRADFGVREAQVAEMRARAEAAERTLDGIRDATETGVRRALVALEAARKRWLVHDTKLVPLARQAFEAERGAYESNRTGYLELLDRARALLDRRLRQADLRRAHAHAHAGLLEAVGVRPAKETQR